MKDYCCQIQSTSGRILEIFYEDFLEALQHAVKTHEAKTGRAQIFHYPDMENPICVMRII